MRLAAVEDDRRRKDGDLSLDIDPERRLADFGESELMSDCEGPVSVVEGEGEDWFERELRGMLISSCFCMILRSLLSSAEVRDVLLLSDCGESGGARETRGSEMAKELCARSLDSTEGSDDEEEGEEMEIEEEERLRGLLAARNRWPGVGRGPTSLSPENSPVS